MLAGATSDMTRLPTGMANSLRSDGRVHTSRRLERANAHAEADRLGAVQLVEAVDQGPLAERWVHAAGCRQWFDVVRDTVSNEFLEPTARVSLSQGVLLAVLPHARKAS